MKDIDSFKSISITPLNDKILLNQIHKIACTATLKLSQRPSSNEVSINNVLLHILML